MKAETRVRRSEVRRRQAFSPLFLDCSLNDLQVLAGQIRMEVDEKLRSDIGGQKPDGDGFTTKRYAGRRVEYRRRDHVRARRPIARRRKTDQQKRWQAIERHNLSLARPGELLLKVWVQKYCRELGWGRSRILKRLYAGVFTGVEIRHVNERLVFVSGVPTA